MGLGVTAVGQVQSIPDLETEILCQATAHRSKTKQNKTKQNKTKKPTLTHTHTHTNSSNLSGGLSRASEDPKSA